MVPFASEQLTAQFYEWELLGRGWLYYDRPVELEAPFTPFFGHFPWSASASRQEAYKDDGIRHTLFSKFLSLFAPAPKEENASFSTDICYTPIPLLEEKGIVVWQAILSKEGKYSPAQTEQFLSMLTFVTRPVSFEIIGSKERILLQLSCRAPDSGYIKAQVQTYFPGVNLVEVVEDFEQMGDDKAYATVDFGLEHEFTRPLQNHQPLDSFTGLFTILEHLEEGEKVIFQVLFNGLVNRWENSIVRAVSDGKGKSFFDNAPEMLPLAKEKVSKPLLAVSVRCLAISDDLDDAFSLLKKITFAVQKGYHSTSNELIPLSDEEYTIEHRITDIYFRESHRLGMLLNTEELATLVHLPSPALLTNKVLGKYRKTKLPPPVARGGSFVLGVSEHGGEKVHVTLPSAQRLKHMHIIGATGTGKSTLLTSMIIQDIGQGHGLAVLDPHGDLIETILTRIPANRIQDVVIIDPSDSEYPVGFNILQAHSEIEKETLSSDLVSAFKRLSTSWGDQMHSVLSNAILAFLESKKGGTLLDLRRFLLETPYRIEFLKSVEDYSVLYYWQKQYPILKSGSIGPILTRLDNFLRSRLIRNMVAQRKSLDFEAILDRRKILLVKLSQGLIGEENSYLLGSFVVSKLHQAALARQAKAERKDFFFYIDEFQHFTTPSMAAILSGARKYHLGLVLAHQDMQQLSRGESELASSVLSNAGTRICFRLSDGDAKKLVDGFSFFEAQDLQNLGTGEAIGRVEKPEHDFSLTTIPLADVIQNAETKEAVIALARQQYASKREDIETELSKTLYANEKEEQTPKLVIAKQRPREQSKHARIAEEKLNLPIHETVPALSEEKVQEVTERLVKQKQESSHRRLQNLVKRLAESKGFKATIEAPLPSGEGKVDVLLEGEGQTIACEISVTTDVSWELHNIQKCLDAGYDRIISCVAEAKSIVLFQNKISQTFAKEEIGKINVMEVEAIASYLDTFSKKGTRRETTIKGYRVTVSHNTVSGQEEKQKKAAVAKIVGEALKKKSLE